MYREVPSRLHLNTVCHIIYLLFSGTWYVILTFVNFCGVVSNAFLIAYTSAWGADYDSEGKLWIVIFFEVNFIVTFSEFEMKEFEVKICQDCR